VQDQDYTVDASKLSSQALSIFAESSKMCVVWRCHERQRLFYWLILAAFLESIALIILVVDSRGQNQFCLAVAAHNGRFPSNLRYITSLCYVITAHMAIFFNFLEDFINIFYNRSERNASLTSKSRNWRNQFHAV